MRYISREIETLLTKVVKQFPAVAVTGPRQCGKSTLLKEVFAKTHQYVSFDDPLVREQAISDPRLFLDHLQERAIIDEIQYVPQLLSYVKMAIDEAREKRGRFIFTGSQQFNMIKNLGDSLAGRIALLDLLPFNIEEKRKIPSLGTSLADALGCFTHASLRGSYPETAIRKDLDLNVWYGTYLRTYLERDVRTLYNIGELRDFQLFMQLLAGRVSQTLNLTHFSRDLGISVNTIKRWVSVLEASRILYLLPPYYQNFGKRVTKAPKVYFLDCGLAAYLTGIQIQDHLLKGPLAGALFENFCIQETVKSFANRGIRPRLFYLRTHNDLEIDLLIEGEGRRLFPFEIKLSKTPNPRMAAPIQRFKALFPKLEIETGGILSLCEKRIPLSREVTVRSLNDYLAWLETLFLSQ